MRFPRLVLGVVGLLGASGCRDLLGIDPAVSVGADSGTTDGDQVIDAPPGACEQRWLDHSVQLKGATTMMVSGSAREPVLSRDGLTLFTSQTVAGGSTQIIESKRPSVDLPFGSASTVSPLSTAEDDLRVTFTADGKTALQTIARPNLALYTSRAADQFSVKLAVASEGAGPRFDGAINADGSRIYYSFLDANTPSLATAQLVNGALVEEEFVRGVAASMTASDPAISPDELVLVFMAQTGPIRRMYYTTRASRDLGFGEIREVADVPTSVGDPFLSADACTLLFVRFSGTTPLEIQEAHVLL